MRDVFSVMRTFPTEHPFCLILDAELREFLSKDIPNAEAKRLLDAYQGDAPYLLIFGALCDPRASCDIEAIEQDSFLHVSAAVHSTNVSLAARGMSQAVWLTVSERNNLSAWMENIRTDNAGNSNPRIIH